MADHSEVIIDAMVVALAAISTGGGASFTPAVVERVDRYNTAKGPLPNIQAARAAYVKDREEFGGNWRADLFVEVLLLIKADKTGTTATDKQVNVAYSDVAAAVIGMDWQTLGANLARIESNPLRTEDEDDPDDGIIITFNVQYKLAFADLTLVVDPS